VRHDEAGRGIEVYIAHEQEDTFAHLTESIMEFPRDTPGETRKNSMIDATTAR
jgi:hypothetical protein